MLHMYQYALYYYKKAAALKPSDARMWCAVGNCFSRLGSKKDAMLTLEKAVHCGDREGTTLSNSVLYLLTYLLARIRRYCNPGISKIVQRKWEYNQSRRVLS